MNIHDDRSIRNEENNFAPTTSQIDLYQSLDEILEDLKKTLNDIPPPRCSKQDIISNWEFVKGIRKEEISDLVKMITKLPNNAIHDKVKEIEQLALRLDIAQVQEFNEGEKMKIMKR